MAELSYREAVAHGIAQEMRRDPALVMLGEDIAAAGGVFKTTVGLLDEFGPDRVRTRRYRSRRSWERRWAPR
jgi:acetoin:2,6-dichlorophenolindophenol oxidoreductase subunit beta